MEYNGGWLKLYRTLITKSIWRTSTPEQKSILIALLCMVNHTPEEWEWKGERYMCKPGQRVTSLDKIATAAGKGISIQNVRTALKKFEEKYDFLTCESTNENRLITIVNWELYQSTDDELTKQLTSDQQATNKRLTTNEECKKDKNEKNIKDYIREIENFRLRYDQESLLIISQYLDILRTTRRSGKINESVICNVYEEMNKYPAIVVKYACLAVINNPNLHSKRENYFYGIMRNTDSEEAERKIKGGSGGGGTKGNTQKDKPKYDTSKLNYQG